MKTTKQPKPLLDSDFDAKQLPGFEQLILAWVKLHRRYLCAFDPQICETSFGYRERSQVSLLGTAAFLCNGVALQEWALAKKGSKRLGRNDLWLQLKERGRDHEYLVEAKHDWIGLENPPDKRLQKLIKSATKSAYKISSKHKSQKLTRLGLALGSITFPSKSLDDADMARSKFISKLKKSWSKHKIQGWAAIWVNASEFFKGPRLDKHTAIGLVMLVKSLDGHY
jgi:hypothetical protein